MDQDYMQVDVDVCVLVSSILGHISHKFAMVVRFFNASLQSAL